MFSLSFVCVSIPTLLLLVFCSALTSNATSFVPQHNANHIFNAIQSSMRQWGSSWHHNGMSFFRATVPEGIQFYHGRGSKDPVTGMEWLAFEPEHAMIFARPRGGHPPPHGSHPPPPPGKGKDGRGRPPPPPGKEGHRKDRGPPAKNEDRKQRGPPSGGPPSSAKPHMRGDKGGSRRHDFETPSPRDQLRLVDEEFKPSNTEDKYGYLHTYRTKHPLSLLYIDGMSAGKSSVGTLDSTDYVLLNALNGTDHDDDMFWEYERGQNLCTLARTEWQGRIDGFIRMEAGFEIILCSFEEHLTTESIQAVRSDGHHGPGMDYDYLRAVASRYDDIGGGRVSVDYDEFVSAYAYDNLDVFSQGDAQRKEEDEKEGKPPFPRLKNLGNESLSALLDEVTQMVLRPWPFPTASSTPTKTPTNWQSKADLLVSRYLAPLQHILSTHPSGIGNDTAAQRRQISSLLAPFTDASSLDPTDLISRCASQLLPPAPSSSPSATPPLPARALATVAQRICRTLVTLDASEEVSDGEIAAEIAALLEWLAWPAQFRCRDACAPDALCFIPIWPMGGVRDREDVRCRDREGLTHVGRGYWGGFGGR